MWEKTSDDRIVVEYDTLRLKFRPYATLRFLDALETGKLSTALRESLDPAEWEMLKSKNPSVEQVGKILEQYVEQMAVRMAGGK